MNKDYNPYEEKEIEEMEEFINYEEYINEIFCDMYGGCAGAACRNWTKCHN